MHRWECGLPGVLYRVCAAAILAVPTQSRSAKNAAAVLYHGASDAGTQGSLRAFWVTCMPVVMIWS